MPLDNVAALIVHGHGSTFSANLVSALAERNVFTVFCNANHTPTVCLWPLSGHYAQGWRMRAQVSAKLPLQKRLWQQLVTAKIETQAAVLRSSVGEDARLCRLARQVRSGDPDNREAQAIRHYWPCLIGSSSRGDRSADGANAMLNYGYTVLRASVGRAIVASGLHSTIALHHRAAQNDVALADDLMEPFRLYVDVVVHGLVQTGHETVCPEVKG